MANIDSQLSTEVIDNQPVTVAVSTEGLEHGLSKAESNAAVPARAMDTKAFALAAELAVEFGFRDAFDVAAALAAVRTEERLSPAVRKLEVALAKHRATVTRAKIKPAQQTLALIQVARGMLRATPQNDALRVALTALEDLALVKRRANRKKVVAALPVK